MSNLEVDVFVNKFYFQFILENDKDTIRWYLEKVLKIYYDFFSHNLFFLVFITLIRFIKDTKNYVKKY